MEGKGGREGGEAGELIPSSPPRRKHRSENKKKNVSYYIIS